MIKTIWILILNIGLIILTIVHTVVAIFLSNGLLDTIELWRDFIEDESSGLY